MKKKIVLIIGAIFLLILAIPVISACKSDIQKAAKSIPVYNITATFNEEDMSILGVQNFEYINTSDEPVSQLQFHLYGNSYRRNSLYPPVASYNISKGYPNGLSYGSMSVSSVMLSGAEVSFSVDGEDEDILIVNLHEEVFPLDKLILDISFDVKLANVMHRLGYSEDTINLGNWYPVLCVMENGEYFSNPYYSNGDPFYSDVANYNVMMQIPSDYVAAFTGKVEKTTAADGITLYEVSAEVVRDFAVVLSKKFETVTQKVNKTDITYYYYDDSNPQLALEYAVNSIKTFSELFGEYPYDTYSVVKADFMYGGMEYPTLVLISDEANEQFNEIIVHETAHQWWYGIVGNNQITEAWIDEGLADFSTALFYENNSQYEKTFEHYIEGASNSYKLFVSIYSQVVKKEDTSMNRRLNEYRTEYEYTVMVYNKSVIMFGEIKKSYGSEKLVKALKRVYDECKYGFVNEAMLKNIFATTVNADVPSIIDSFITGKVII